MTHEQLQDRLGEWLDGALDAPASAAVSSHVDACADCKGEACRLRRLGAALFKSPAADPRSTGAFVASVMARIDAESVSPWERFAARVLAPAFALAIAGLLFTILAPRADMDAPLGIAAAAVDADYVLEATP